MGAEMTNSPTIKPPHAAICRDKFEGGNGHRYFGSLMSYSAWCLESVELGLLTEKSELTDFGRQLGEACSRLPARRFVEHGDEYRAVIVAVLRGRF
jgi:hypothetical protein